MVLLDTNVLLRLGNPGSPEHPVIRQAIRLIGADKCVLVPQVLYEYWVVATRPVEGNGMGMDCLATRAAIEKWTDAFTVFRDERGIYDHWIELVSTYEVKGKNAHDARLVAAMKRHRITELLSFNQADFKRYPGMTVRTPHDVVQTGQKLT